MNEGKNSILVGDRMLKDELAQEMKKLYPDMKDYLIERYTKKYTECVLDEIRESIIRPRNQDDELSFNALIVREKCGQMKDKRRLWKFIQQSDKTRFVEIKFLGNKGKMSRVVLNPKYEEKIMDELLGSIDGDLTRQEQKDLHENANKVIEIDIASLHSYIAEGRETLKTAFGNYKMKISDNIIKAQKLVTSAHEIEGKHYLMEHWITADTGREYGRYKSLQRMPKEVRVAALGFCHQYDFQAHSFAVMASLAKAIDPDIKIAAIKQYIKYRTQYRKKIAEAINVPERAIKEVFTMLGFGAKPINNPHMGIRRAVYSQQAFDALLVQEDFKYIIEDLTKINQTILNTYPKNQDFEGFGGYKFITLKDTGKHRSDAQRLAWIYQNIEAHITSEFVRIIRERNQMEPLMTVHDCVYYKDPVPSNTLLDAQMEIREGFEFVKVDHEKLFPIGTAEFHATRTQDYDQEIIDHKDRMVQTESLARGYVSETTDHTAIVERYDPVAALIRYYQYKEMPDVGEYEYEYEYNVREHKVNNPL